MVVASVIAAVASIVAALLSWKSARDSRQEAGRSLRTNQLVAAHDRAIERLRTDVGEFVQSLVTPGLSGQGAMMAAVTVLAINPMCTPQLRKMAGDLAGKRIGSKSDGIDDMVHALEDEARSILEQADGERLRLLS